MESGNRNLESLKLRMTTEEIDFNNVQEINMPAASTANCNCKKTKHLTAVDPSVRDQLKCQAYVATYGRWSLTEVWTILGQNFDTLAHLACRTSVIFLRM